MSGVRFNGANKATNVSLDDFRQMVNYDNTKNKGYVRMALGGDGKVVLQKVNNKIDCPLCFRFNMGKDNNIALRDLFSRSISNDMKYMDRDTRLQIEKMITSPKNKDHKVDTGKALARVDVRAIFEKFDAHFNTDWGRRDILRAFVRDARAQLNVPPEVTEKEFLDNYLRLEENGCAGFDEYLKVKEGEIKEDATVRGTDKINTHEQMVKSEADFRQLLFFLEGRVESAKHFAEMTESMQGFAVNLLKSQDGKFDLTEDDKAHLRNDLVHIRHELGLDSLDTGNALGTSGNITELFMKLIVPSIIRSGVDVIQNAGEKGDDAQMLQQIREHFSMEELVNLYKEFLTGANSALNATEVPKYDMGAFQEMMDNVNNMDIMDVVNKATLLLKNMTGIYREEAAEIRADIVKVARSNEGQAKVNRFALQFVKEHFASQVSKNIVLDTRATDITMNEDVKKMVAAAQIQFGSKITKPGESKGVKQLSTKDYIQEMGSVILPTVCNKVRGGEYVYSKLLSHTLSSIINSEIADATRDTQEYVRVIYDKTPLPEQQAQLETMAGAYMKFRGEDGALQKMVDRTIRSFEKLTQTLVKKGKIDEKYNAERATILNKLSLRMDEAIERMTDAYFDQIPMGKSEADYLKDLKDLFNAEKQELVEDLNIELNNMIFGHLPGNRDAEVLLNTKQNITNILLDLKKDSKYDVLLTQCERDVRPTLERMYNKSLSQALKGVKIGKDYNLPKDFVKKFLSGFAPDVKKVLDNFAKFDKSLDKTTEALIKDALTQQLEGDVPLWREYKNLTKKEVAAFVDDFVSDVKHGLQPRMQEIRKDYLSNPEKFTRGRDLTTAIDWHIGLDTTAKGLNGVCHDVILNRSFNLDNWTRINKTETKQSKELGKKTFNDQLMERASKKIDDLDVKAVADKKIARELDWGEKHKIANAASKNMIDRLKKYSILYGKYEQTEENKNACLERIRKEFDADVDARFDKYIKLRNDFLAKTKEAREVTYSALTTDYIEKLLINFLEYRLADDYENGTADDFAKEFTGILENTKNERIEEEKQVAAEAEERITRAFNNTRDTFEKILLDGEQRLRDAGASDSDIEFYKSKLVPQLKENFVIELNNRTNRYLGEEGVANAKLKGESYIGEMVMRFKHLSLTTAEGVDELIRMANSSLFSEMKKSESLKESLHEAIRAWAKLPANVELVNEARRAMMVRGIFGGDSMCQLAVDYRDKYDQLSDELGKNLVGYLTEVRISNLNENDMPLAQQLFKTWIQQYNFPKTTFARDKGANRMVTIEDVAMEMFVEHTKETMEKLVANPFGRQAREMRLLDADFLMKMLEFVNTSGMTVMLSEVSADYVDKKIAEKMGQEGSEKYFYNPKNPDFKLDSDIQTAKLINYNCLISQINENATKAANLIENQFTSVEQLSRWRQRVETIYDKSNYNMNSTWMSAQSRIEQLTQLADMNGDEVSERLVDEAMKEFFGVDLRSHDFSASINKMSMTPMMLRNEIVSRMKGENGIFETVKQNLIKTATSSQITGNIFRCNFEGDHRLDETFKTRIGAEIRAIATNKKSSYYKTVNAMMKELKVKL